MADMQDFASQYAQLLSDQQKNQRRMQMAQQLQQAGYIPNSGIGGVIGSVLQSVLGNKMMGQEEGKMSEILQRQFALQNQQSQAEQAQKLADEQRKFERDILAAQKKAEAEAKAKRDYAAPEWKDGGVFDPASGKFTADPNYAKWQLDFARQKAAIEAANRPPTDLAQRLALAQKAGATPEQLKALILGQQGGNAPSGYRQTPEGNLEAIPGGPADKPKETDPKAAAAQQAMSVLSDLERKIKSGSAWTGPIDKFLPGEGQQSFQAGVDALVNPFQTLTRIPGQGAQSDKELAQLMAQFPSLGNREEVNMEAIQRLREYISRIQQSGQPAGGATQQPAQISDQELLKKYGGM